MIKYVYIYNTETLCFQNYFWNLESFWIETLVILVKDQSLENAK